MGSANASGRWASAGSAVRVSEGPPGGGGADAGSLGGGRGRAAGGSSRTGGGAAGGSSRAAETRAGAGAGPAGGGLAQLRRGQGPAGGWSRAVETSSTVSRAGLGSLQFAFNGSLVAFAGGVRVARVYVRPVTVRGVPLREVTVGGSAVRWLQSSKCRTCFDYFLFSSLALLKWRVLGFWGYFALVFGFEV